MELENMKKCVTNSSLLTSTLKSAFVYAHSFLVLMSTMQLLLTGTESPIADY